VNRIVLAGVLACTAVMSNAPRIDAQPANAIGQWLPDSTMAGGTITVRVVAGTPSAPVAGTEVTLVVGDQPRAARTDSSGRATFTGLPAGASVQAKVVDAESKEQVSAPFAVPPSGGARVMLSTKPFSGTAGLPPGQGGMPEARQVSGQPRPDRGVPGGTYQIRVTYNASMAGDPTPPIGETVTLVGYSFDDRVSVRTAKVDAGGHAQFEKLDVSGDTAYFALARMPRNGAADRLMTTPIQPDGQAGIKAVLSSEKRDSPAIPIDDLSNQDTLRTPPGKVRITLDGFPTEAAEINLIDAATGNVVAHKMPAQGQPDPSNVQGQAKFEVAADLPKGTLAIKVHGGAGTDDKPIGDVPIRVIPADAPQTAEGIASKAAADGIVQLTVPPDKQYKVVLTINGRDLVSTPFDLSKTGGRLDVTARWETEGRPEAVFDVAFQPDLVLYAESTMRMPEARDANRRAVYRTLPFQLLEGTGTHAGILVYPRVLLRFSLRSFVEDDLLAVRGQFLVENHSWSPFRSTADGMIIQLPKGFKGAGVADENQADVSVAAGEGLRIIRAIPPMGRKTFVAGFSLGAEAGEVKWHLDLPLGVFQSAMEIKYSPGMQVRTASDTRPELVSARDGGKWYVMDNITIKPAQAMVMTITGLPAAPAWKLWAPRIIGVLVLLMMIGGIAFAMARRGAVATAAGDAARRTQLLDELVELERSGKNTVRRDQVLAELEKLWRD
jgi:hypothetical protein